MKASPFTIILNGTQHNLTWDNAATFRADDTGLVDKLAKGKFGYSTLCKMIWVCLDDAGREAFSSPEAVAKYLPIDNSTAAWEVVMKAYIAGTGRGDSEAKKTNGEAAPSPVSS